MLYLDLRRICSEKGIESLSRYLTKHGFPSYTAGRLVRLDQQRISLDLMERLCKAFYCTPNDLLTIDGAADELPAGHPLKQLRRTELQTNIAGKLQKLPVEKLEQVRQLIDQLEQG